MDFEICQVGLVSKVSSSRAKRDATYETRSAERSEAPRRETPPPPTTTQVERSETATEGRPPPLLPYSTIVGPWAPARSFV